MGICYDGLESKGTLVYPPTYDSKEQPGTLLQSFGMSSFAALAKSLWVFFGMYDGINAKSSG